MTAASLPVPGRSAAPIVEYGPGAIDQVPAIVGRMGAQRVLLVCGRTSFEASGADRMLPELEQVAAVRRWSAFRPNTDSADLAAGVALLQDHRPDLVLGIGGGSALDMAKLLVGYHDVAPDQVVPAIEAGRPAERRTAHLVLAPTTSGSGAEATHFAVVYVGEEKHSITGPAMRPDAIVLDPALTLSGSRYQRATSGIDAVTQAIESLWSVAATDRSRRFARHALRLLLPAIETFVDGPDDRSARAMAIGSHLAGRAIDISKTTAAHALSYGITKRHGLSHGHAVALTLGAFIEAHATAPPRHLQPAISPEDHARTLAAVLGLFGTSDPTAARRSFEDLLDRLGLETRLGALGIDAGEDLRQLAATVNTERLGNNPVAFDTDGLVRLLTSLRH